jgi:hypothetical protein
MSALLAGILNSLSLAPESKPLPVKIPDNQSPRRFGFREAEDFYFCAERKIPNAWFQKHEPHGDCMNNHPWSCSCIGSDKWFPQPTASRKQTRMSALLSGIVNSLSLAPESKLLPVKIPDNRAPRRLVIGKRRIIYLHTVR